MCITQFISFALRQTSICIENAISELLIHRILSIITVNIELFALYAQSSFNNEEEIDCMNIPNLYALVLQHLYILKVLA